MGSQSVGFDKKGFVGAVFSGSPKWAWLRRKSISLPGVSHPPRRSPNAKKRDERGQRSMHKCPTNENESPQVQGRLRRGGCRCRCKSRRRGRPTFSPRSTRKKLFFASPFPISNTPSHSLPLPLRFASWQERPRELAAIREGRWGRNKAMGCCKFCADKKICRGPPPPSPCPIVTARMCALPLLQMRCKKKYCPPPFSSAAEIAQKKEMKSALPPDP